jgi:hypothetical protein
MPDGSIVSPALDDMFPFLDPEDLPRTVPALVTGLAEGVKPS